MNVKNTYFCFILVEYGSFQHSQPSFFFFEHNRKPHELVKKVITDEFLKTCVAATNPHGEDDEEFTRLYLDDIPEDESGCALVRVTVHKGVSILPFQNHPPPHY